MAKTESQTEKTPFGPRWIVSGVVVLLALGLVAFMALRGGSEAEEEPAPLGSASSSAPAHPGPAEPEPQAETSDTCTPPKPRETNLPTKAPTVSWERHPSGGVVPVSDGHGPMSRDGEFWRCSSRTPSGAVLAGMTLVYNFATGDKASMSDGKNREEQFSRGQYGSNTEFGTVEGYRVLLANQSDAEVEYLISVSGGHAVMRVPMVWDESVQDWSLNGNSNDTGATVTDSPSGFTNWR